jgi:predicted dehydrogenase
MQFKINLIGLGIMGKNVARALQRNPMVNMTAAADLNEKTCEEAKSEFNFEKTYKDYEKML